MIRSPLWWWLRLLILGLVLCLLNVGAVRGYQQPTATSDPAARLLTPATGSVVFGTVTFTGNANSPSLQSYRLEFIALPDGTAWQPIGRVVTQQVTNGILAQWDTATLKDGIYRIRLRVTLRNGTVLEDYVNDLRLQNTQPTALPTQIPLPSDTPVPLPNAPTPTALFIAPPVTTPRPTSGIVAPPVAGVTQPPTAIPPPTSPPLDSGVTVANPLTAGAIQAAMCNGALLAAIGFGLLALYQFLRGRLRP